MEINLAKAAKIRNALTKHVVKLKAKINTVVSLSLLTNIDTIVTTYENAVAAHNQALREALEAQSLLFDIRNIINAGNKVAGVDSCLLEIEQFKTRLHTLMAAKEDINAYSRRRAYTFEEFRTLKHENDELLNSGSDLAERSNYNVYLIDEEYKADIDSDIYDTKVLLDKAESTLATINATEKVSLSDAQVESLKAYGIPV